jgi:hypothetical protein
MQEKRVVDDKERRLDLHLLLAVVLLVSVVVLLVFQGPS